MKWTASISMEMKRELPKCAAQNYLFLNKFIRKKKAPNNPWRLIKTHLLLSRRGGMLKAAESKPVKAKQNKKPAGGWGGWLEAFYSISNSGRIHQANKFLHHTAAATHSPQFFPIIS